MKRYVWLGLRVLGSIALIGLCLDATNDIGFVTAALFGSGLRNTGVFMRASALAASMLLVLPYWGYRVVRRRIGTGGVATAWRSALRVGAGVVLSLVFLYAGWRGWWEWVSMHGWRVHPFSPPPTVGGPLIVPLDAPITVILTYRLGGAAIDLVFASMFLAIVTVFRLLVVRRRRRERSTGSQRTSDGGIHPRD